MLRWALGVNGADWGADWVTARMVEGLEYQDFILPSFSERSSCWTDSPMSASEATYWLRESLGESSPMGVFKYGSHSCKSTLLTWAGRCVKIPFSPMEHRLLGHDLEPSIYMKSILTYSREAFTTVYSKVLQMFRLMRDGTYNPDLPALIALSSSQKLLQRSHKQLVLTHRLLMHVTVIQNPVWLPIVVQLVKIAVNRERSTRTA